MDDHQQILSDVLDRLTALERENRDLRAQVATLTNVVAPRVEHHATEGTEQIDRRAVLRRGMQAIAASVTAGALLARDADDVSAIHGGTDTAFYENVRAHYVEGHGSGVVATTTIDDGQAMSAINFGSGHGMRGLTGGSTGGAGVKGENRDFGPGVLGVSASGYGVQGEGSTGLYGRSTSATGAGVSGEGPTGVSGSSDKPNFSAIYGQHQGGGWGIYGDTESATHAGVEGRNQGGVAVRGVGRTGVHGESMTAYGYGGVFKGGRAQLRLIPAATFGKPKRGAHVMGELFLDRNANLFVCTVNGTPGTWKRVTVV